MAMLSQVIACSTSHSYELSGQSKVDEDTISGIGLSGAVNAAGGDLRQSRHRRFDSGMRQSRIPMRDRDSSVGENLAPGPISSSKIHNLAVE
jgi:hypothetical protein